MYRILRYIRPELGGRPCILVANKTDLVRNRVVRTGGEKIILIYPQNQRLTKIPSAYFMVLESLKS